MTVLDDETDLRATATTFCGATCPNFHERQSRHLSDDLKTQGKEFYFVADAKAQGQTDLERAMLARLSAS
jgi:hypothetical protein